MNRLDWQEYDKKLQSVDDRVVLEGLTELKKYTDENKNIFEKEAVDALVPQCIDKLEHHDLEARSFALSILAQQYCLDNPHLEPYIADICRQLDLPNLLDIKQGSPSNKNYIALHQCLCTLICELQAKHAGKLMPHFKPLVQYLVDCTAHDNKDIATAACDYWARLTIPPVHPSLMDKWVPAMLSRLGKLIPAFLRNLVYNEKHLNYLEGRIHGSEDTDLPKELEGYTNLRNYAALGFENMCRIFQTEATIKFKPYLEKWLNSANWLETEAIILALAAFTEAVGTPRDLQDLYPQIIPKFVEFYSHPRPLIRSITCFTMQHFINAEIRNVKDPFTKMLKCTLSLLTDNHREVQEMAIQSLSAMLAYANRDITPHVQKILTALVKADPVLRGRARYTYYECISHLFGRMGILIEEKDIETLIKPIMTHWEILDFEKIPSGNEEQDQTFIVCQPLCVIAMYSKSNFAVYNERILAKAIPYIRQMMELSSEDANTKEVVTMRVVAHLDLLSAMFEGQGKELRETSVKYDLTHLMLAILKCSSFKEEVHQSCLALLGHICNHCPSDIETRMDETVNILTTQLGGSNNAIRNNALWCLSHIITKCTAVPPNVYDLKGKMVEILLNNGDDGFLINAALALTALANQAPEQLTDIILKEEVFVRLCTLLQRPFPREGEKVTIFKNLCSILSPNIKEINRQGWIHFCITAAVLDVNNEELISRLRVLLREARGILGTPAWNKVSQQVGPQLAISLRKKYKLY